MRVALVTRRDLPEWERDDRPLHAALEALDVELRHPAWDDPGVDWGEHDACLIRTTWDYTARVEDFVAWAARIGQRSPLFNPPEVVRWNADKRYLRQLEAAGVPHAPTVWIEAGAPIDLSRTLRARRWGRALLKPVVGCSAEGTCRFDDSPASLAQAQAQLEVELGRRPAGMMLQPYLPSVETLGERSALFFDGAYSHGVRKVPVPGDYRVQDDHGASDEPYRFEGPELALAREVVAAAERALGLDRPLLYARVDFLQREDGTPTLTELELIEPSLFFRHDPSAAPRLARALVRRIDAAG